jgi:hypothetical protein
MKKVFWHPNGRGWGSHWGVAYRPRSHPKGQPPMFTKYLPSGLAREEFIREQSKMIRKFETNEDYQSWWISVQALMKD